MKIKKILLVFILLASSALTKAHAEQYFLDENLSQGINVETINQIRVYQNISCFKKCQAAIKVKKKIKLKKENAKNYEGSFNPALIICDHLEGELNIVMDDKKNAISICQYPDGSFFFSWDYFYRYSKNKEKENISN